MNYENKDSNYYSNIRKDLIGLISKKNNPLTVMEIGAAYGETLFYLKKNEIAKEIVGVELFEDIKNKNRYKKVDKFIFGNIENIELPEYENYFDLILLPDVLEHLLEPLKVLEKVQNYLKSDGEVIVSMPNIRHYSAFIKIFLKGNFKYEESGLFDYTHLRFYCKKDIKALLQSSNFKILSAEGSIRNYKGKSIAKIINTLTFGIFEEFFSVQFYFKVRKA
jgi:SAM-dependent methyltransferase